MNITLPLSTDERNALRRFMSEHDLATMEDAASSALRDWLIGNGYLEEAEADNDNGDA